MASAKGASGNNANGGGDGRSVRPITFPPKQDPRFLTLTMPYTPYRAPAPAVASATPSSEHPPPSQAQPQQQYRQLAIAVSDQKYVKAALQRQGTTASELVGAAPSSRTWALAAVALFGILALVLVVGFILFASSRRDAATTMTATDARGKRSPLNMPSTPERNKRARPEDWAVTPSPLNDSECGFGTRLNQASVCEPDYAALLDKGTLEGKRRGACAAPASLSKWVCGDYEADRRNIKRKIVDNYLQARARQWMAHAFSSATPGRGAFLDRMIATCASDSDAKRSGSARERLRREALAVDSWEALWRVAGTAAAYGIDAIACVDSVHGTLGLCKRAGPSGDGDLVAMILPDPSAPATYLGINGTAFGSGFSEGFRRAGIDAPESWLSSLALVSCNLSSAATLDEWKLYLARRVSTVDADSSSLRKASAPYLQHYVVRELSALDGPLDPDGAPVLYLIRAFEQLREAYSDAVRESASLRDSTKTKLLASLSLVQFSLPPFEALTALVATSDAAVSSVPTESCQDTLMVGEAARVARAVSRVFSERQLFLADQDLFAFEAVKYFRSQNSIVVTPLALTTALYRPPSDASDPYSMVDAYGRLGWRLARELASSVDFETPDAERVALCAAYRVLCKHSPSRCASIEPEDLDWIRRFLWDVAATGCGDPRRSTALDAAASSYPLYRIAFSCNGLFLYKNISSEALDCWKKQT